MNNNSTRVELVSRFYRKNHCALFLALSASILNGLTGIIVSWILKELIDLISGQSAYSFVQILLICTGFFGLEVLIMLLNYFAEPSFIRRAMTQYKNKAFWFLSQKNISSFRKEASASYLSALTNDASAVETNYVASIMPIMTKIVSFFGSLILMFLNSPILTLFSVLIIIIPMLVSAIMGKKMAKVQKEVSDQNTEFTSAINDCLGGFQVVKSFRAENEVNRLFVNENGKLEDAKCHLRRIASLTGSLGLMAGIISQLGVFLFGTYLVQTGKGITAGSILMFVNLMNFLIPPVAELPKLLAGKKAARGLIEKLSDSLSRNNGSSGEAEVEAVTEKICFQDVSFAYEEGEKEVLHDINCEFLPGRSYAIVGASGSGKSTFLNLLMTANDDYKGKITIDGQELRSIRPESLYDLMSVIQQNVFIFNASIKDNVTLFRDFPEEKVAMAMNKAHIEELIRERGEDYLCGENGKGLSGGEKQRISIARSLLKDSSILLADEATSALDAKTSYEVINEILELDSMTRIVVTHTLEESLLRRYDEIVVIKDGTIEEKGSFETLMNNNGYFKALYTVAK
ncbi:MAG: ABC transporter ATP-binding protein [Clostridiales bacterium]|nr:ABC transporter ATP-binding protein [Clostridiales bacterium]